MIQTLLDTALALVAVVLVAGFAYGAIRLVLERRRERRRVRQLLTQHLTNGEARDADRQQRGHR